MKRSLHHIWGSAVLALGFSLATLVWAQETIVYPDDFPPRALQTINCAGASSGNVLTTTVTRVGGNDKSLIVTGNTIVARNVVGTVNPDYVFGAVNCQDTTPANGNRAFITGGTVDSVYGARHRLGSNADASVNNNQISISGGTIRRVIGGNAYGLNASAIGNIVEITGGMIREGVYGGWAISNDNGSGIIESRNNTVSIGANLPASTFAAFGTPAWLSGGIVSGNMNRVFSTGNTLQIASAGLSVGGLSYFQRFEFTLPAALSGGGTMLTAVFNAYIGTGSTVTVSAAAGLTVNTGDVFTLIDCQTCRAGEFIGTVAAASQQGVLLGHRYTLSKTSDRLLLTIGDKLADPLGPTRDYTGQWHKPDEYAWGLTVLQNFPGQPRYIFVPWYTYDKDGKAAWYIFQGDVWSADDTFSADVYRYSGPDWGTTPYHNDRITNTKVGTAKLTFTSATTARFEYDVEGSKRTIELRKLE